VVSGGRACWRREQRASEQRAERHRERRHPVLPHSCFLLSLGVVPSSRYHTRWGARCARMSHHASTLILMVMSTLHSPVLYVDSTSSRFSRSTSHCPHATIHKPQFALTRAGHLDRSERLGFSIGDFGFYSVFVSMFYNFRV